MRADRSRYEGAFLKGIPSSGQGTLISASGDKYEGFFVGGKLLGIGTLISANGSQHKGEFVDGKPLGKENMT